MIPKPVVRLGSNTIDRFNHQDGRCRLFALDWKVETDAARGILLRFEKGTSVPVCAQASFLFSHSPPRLIHGNSRTGYRAFIEVLSKRQTAYGEVISWLKKEVERINSTGRSSGSSAKLEKSLCT